MRKNTIFLIVAATLAYCGIGNIDRNNVNDPKATNYTGGSGAGGSSDTTAPTTPGTFTATANGAAQIDLSWTASTDNVTAQSALVYQICQVTSSGGCNSFSATYTTSAGVVTFSATGLSASTAYYFRIRAKDGAGNTSSAASEVSATTTTVFVNSLSLDGLSDAQFSFGAATLILGYTFEARIKGTGANMFSQIFYSWESNVNVPFGWIGTDGSGHLQAAFVPTTCPTTGTITGTTVLTVGTKYHVALVVIGANSFLYLNGNQEASSVGASVSCANLTYIRIGAQNNGTGRFTGVIDEVRYSNIQRYSGASYTVPTVPFTNDANTVFLQHFDVNGTTVDNTTLTGIGVTPTGTLSIISSPFP